MLLRKCIEVWSTLNLLKQELDKEKEIPCIIVVYSTPQKWPDKSENCGEAWVEPATARTRKSDYVYPVNQIYPLIIYLWEDHEQNI